MGCNNETTSYESIGRYTTPTITVNVPIDLRQANVYVTFKQNDQIVLEKTNEDITIEANKITIPLTQEDTAKFVSGMLLFQIRYVFIDGTSDFSYPLVTTVIDVYKQGVLEYV